MLTFLSTILTILLLVSPAMATVDSGLKLRSSSVVRYLGMFKVYTAYLYTDDQVAEQDILAATTSRCLRLNYAVDLKPEVFIEAAETILSRQHDQSTIAGVRQEIDLLHASYQEVQEGDTYTLCYDGTTAITRLSLNDESLISIQSADFGSIYFGIWLARQHGIVPELTEPLATRTSSQ